MSEVPGACFSKCPASHLDLTRASSALKPASSRPRLLSWPTKSSWKSSQPLRPGKVSPQRKPHSSMCVSTRGTRWKVINRGYCGLLQVPPGLLRPHQGSQAEQRRTELPGGSAGEEDPLYPYCLGQGVTQSINFRVSLMFWSRSRSRLLTRSSSKSADLTWREKGMNSQTP